MNVLANADAVEVGTKALRDLVKSHESLLYLGTGKIKCSVTQHEMKPEEELVRAHLASKRFKLEKGYQMNYDHLLPWIKQHKKDRRKLMCMLTGFELNKIPEQLALHTRSKRYLRLKKEGEEKLIMKEEKKKRKEELRIKRVERAKARKEALSKESLDAAGEGENAMENAVEEDPSDSSDDDDENDSDSSGEEEEEEEEDEEEGEEGEDGEDAKEETEKNKDERVDFPRIQRNVTCIKDRKM